MKKLLLQAIKFVGLSGIGWLIDFFTYIILGGFSDNLTLNNIISSWLGVTFVFFFATKKVFQNNSKISLKWKYIIYLVYQCVLIYCVSKLLGVINVWILENVTFELIQRFSAIVSKVIVTPITMILNFFAMKGVIEKL